MSCTVHPQFPQSDYLSRGGICGVSMEQATRNGNEHFKAENWWLELEYNLPFWNFEFHPFSCELLVFLGEGNHCIYPTSFHIQALTAHFFRCIHKQNSCFTWKSQWKTTKTAVWTWWPVTKGIAEFMRCGIFQECTKSTAKTMPKASAYNSHQASRNATVQQCQQSQALKSYITWIFVALLGGASPR